jgi:hypothetical protein
MKTIAEPRAKSRVLTGYTMDVCVPKFSVEMMSKKLSQTLADALKGKSVDRLLSLLIERGFAPRMMNENTVLIDDMKAGLIRLTWKTEDDAPVENGIMETLHRFPEALLFEENDWGNA